MSKPNNAANNMLVYNMGEGVTAFSTRRHGLGVSAGAYGELNINPFCGDNLRNVDRNLSLLADSLHLDKENILLPHQVHGNNVAIVDDVYFSLSMMQRQEYLDGVDAVITAHKNVCVGVSTADCVPILILDPQNRVAAAVHAGWRGTVQQIAIHTVQQMAQHFHSNANDLRAVIGPSISKAAFEVGDEVYEAFANMTFAKSACGFSKDHSSQSDDLDAVPLNATNLRHNGSCLSNNLDGVSSSGHGFRDDRSCLNKNLDSVLLGASFFYKDLSKQSVCPATCASADGKYVMSDISCRIDGRWHIDLWEANRIQLLSIGLSPENIAVAGICTYSNPNEFFSARRLSVNSGRIYSGIFLCSENC